MQKNKTRSRIDNQNVGEAALTPTATPNLTTAEAANAPEASELTASHTASEPAASPAPEAPGELPRRTAIAVFVALMVAMTVGALDQTVVATALPTIVGELGGATHILWVTTAYVLASTVTMPIYGKMGDLMGRKGLFLGSLVLFAAGSILCGLANSMALLIAGRAVQGLGGGGLIILSQAIVADVIPPRQRALFLSIMGIGYALPTLIGPLLGGFFTDTIGWRWAFWINLPLSAIALIIALVCIPKPRRPLRGGKFDIAGTLALTSALCAITLATSWGGTEYAWDSPIIVGLFALAVASAALFVLAERRAAEPIVALYLFRSRNFNIATIAGFITTFVMMGMCTYLPTYFQIVDGMSATAAGFMEVPMNIAWFISSLLSGALVSKSGRYKSIMVASFVIMTIGVAAFTVITAQTPVAYLGVMLSVIGFGMGLNFEILVLIVQNEFSASDVGMSTAATNLFREMGTTLGASLTGAIFTGNLATTLTNSLAGVGGAESLGVSADSLTPAIAHALPDAVRVAVNNAYNDALLPVFWIMLPLAIGGAALLLFLKERPLSTEHGE